MATKVAIEVDVKTGEANDDIISLREELEKVKAAQEEMTRKIEAGFKASENGAKGAGQGMKKFGGTIKGVLKSLGLIAIAVEVFNYLKDLLMSNQTVADAVAKAFKVIEVVFGNVAVAVKNLADDLSNLSSFSLKDIWNAFTNFGTAVKNSADGAVELADKLVKLRNEVKLAEAQQGLLILEYQKEAEVQRQIRDDVSRTIEERQEANRRLGEILDEQTQEELKLANKRLELALLEQSINKDSIDAEIEVINARKEIADINERITGQRSEQLTNENALKKEGIDISKEQIKQLEEEAEAERAAAFKIAEAKANAQKVLDDYLAERESLSREEMIQKEIDDALAVEEAKFQAAVQAAQEQGVLLEELDALELAREEERLRLENEIREKYAQEDLEREKEIADALAKVEEENVKAVKEAEAAKRKLREDGLTAAGAVLGSLGQLIAASGNQSKEAVALQKTLAVAQIAIDTAKAITGAIAQAQSVPYPANLVAIATGVAAVVAGIASAVQTLNTANVPGGTAQPPQAPQVATAPAIQQATAGTTELGGAEQAQLAPIQAYVVETEVTGNQNNVNQIESQATFGG